MTLADDNVNLEKLVNYDSRWQVAFDESGEEWVYINKAKLDRYEVIELAHWAMHTFGDFGPIKDVWGRNVEMKAPDKKPDWKERIRQRMKAWL